MSEKAYRIKPLVWEYMACESSQTHSAKAIGVVYAVQRWAGTDGELEGWYWWFETKDGDTGERLCCTVEQGKALAEAHWRETITMFLEEVTHE